MIEQQRSRSVIIPVSFRDCWSTTTGTDPTLCSHIMIATFCAVSPGTQQAGLGVITSFIFMVFLQVGVAQVPLPVPGLSCNRQVWHFLLRCKSRASGWR